MSAFSYQLLRTAIRQYPKDRTLRLIRKTPHHVITGSPADGSQSPLHTASQVLDSDLVEALLEKGADAKGRAADGETPLHCALSSLNPRGENFKASRLRIVALLLGAGADVSAVDEDGNTALHLAILHGHIDCARLLLIHDDFPLTIPNKRGEIPLFVSAASQAAAAPPMDMAGFLTRWHILNRPLHRAVATGDIKTVYDALESGEDISARNMLGDAAIHLAAVRGDVNMVRFLLYRGACPGQPGYLGQTALHRSAAAAAAAADSDRPNYTHGIDAPVQRCWTEPEVALFRSVSEHRHRELPGWLPDPARHLEVAETLLDTGLSATVPDALLRTPLHLAAAAGDEALVQLLLAHGADPNAPDLDLKTPLVHAAAGGNVDLLAVLFRHGASLRLQPEPFRDVGHLAVQCGRRCVSADMLNASDEQGRTPLVRAVQGGALAAADRLLQAGAYLGQLGKGWSPIVQACDRRHWGVARLLLRRGADVREYEHDLKTSHATALHLAARGGSADTIREILHAEAKVEEPPEPKREYLSVHSRRPSVQSFRSGVTVLSTLSEATKVANSTGKRIGFYKWTPLHYAVSMRRRHAVNALLGDMDRMEIIARDVDGFTAMELAEAAGYKEIARLIEERLS